MVFPVYVCGRCLASFEPRPGFRAYLLAVPGGSQMLETTLADGVHKVLYAPTADPMCLSAWSALGAVKAARSSHSRFRLIKVRHGSDTHHGKTTR